MTNTTSKKLGRTDEPSPAASGRLDDILSQAQTTASEFLNGEPGKQMTELSQEWAAEATQFIRRNPWVAVAGAAAIGYYLGSTRNRGGGSR